MSTDVNNQPCQCELCQPNWYLGRDEVFETQPAEAPARKVTLEDHVRNVSRQAARRAQADQAVRFAPAG